jgi:hypothetical protein
LAVAFGIQKDINWSGVALSELSAGITAGIGASGLVAGQTLVPTAARAMLANALTQGIGVVTGLQDHFSWRNVAAAGVGAAAGYGVGEVLGMHAPAFVNAGFGERLVKGAISGFAAGVAAAVARGGRVTVQQVAVDAFGNSLGNSIAEYDWSGAAGRSVSYTPDEQTQDYARENARFASAAATNADSAMPLTTAQRQALAMGYGPLTPEAAQAMTTDAIGDIADGAKLDMMGQPLNERSNYDAWKQFGKIMSDAGKNSIGTTAGQLWDWATYTTPDAAQRAAEIQARYGSDPRFAQIDQMRESPLGAIGWLGAKAAGASPASQQMWLDIGTAADGLAMSGAALAGRAPAFTGARTMPELVEEPKLFEPYNRTRINVEREMFRTPNDELSVIISRETGAEVMRQLVPGTGGTLSPEMIRNLEGNTFTHFHPLGGNFSPADVRTGLGQGAAEIRAVMEGRSISMNFESAPEGLRGNPAAAYDFIKNEQAAIGQSYRVGIANGTLSPPSDPVAKSVWQSDYFAKQLVQRNNWIRYTATPH